MWPPHAQGLPPQVGRHDCSPSPRSLEGESGLLALKVGLCSVRGRLDFPLRLSLGQAAPGRRGRSRIGMASRRRLCRSGVPVTLWHGDVTFTPLPPAGQSVAGGQGGGLPDSGGGGRPGLEAAAAAGGEELLQWPALGGLSVSSGSRRTLWLSCFASRRGMAPVD